MLASLLGVVLFYRRSIGSTLVDGDHLRSAALVDGLAQEARGRCAITLGSQEEFNGVTSFIDSAIEILPLTFDADVRFL